jgi:hypothetical protein
MLAVILRRRAGADRSGGLVDAAGQPCGAHRGYFIGSSPLQKRMRLWTCGYRPHAPVPISGNHRSRSSPRPAVIEHRNQVIAFLLTLEFFCCFGGPNERVHQLR